MLNLVVLTNIFIILHNNVHVSEHYIFSLFRQHTMSKTIAIYYFLTRPILLDFLPTVGTNGKKVC